MLMYKKRMRKTYFVLCFALVLFSCSAESSVPVSPDESSTVDEGDIGFQETATPPSIIDGSSTVFEYPDLDLRKIKTGASTSVIITSQDSSYLSAFSEARSLLDDSAFIYSSTELESDSFLYSSISFVYEDESYYLNLSWSYKLNSGLLTEFGIDGDYYVYSIDCSFVDSTSVEGDVSGMTLFGYTAESAYFEKLSDWITQIDNSFTIYH